MPHRSARAPVPVPPRTPKCTPRSGSAARGGHWHSTHGAGSRSFRSPAAVSAPSHRYPDKPAPCRIPCGPAAENRPLFLQYRMPSILPACGNHSNPNPYAMKPASGYIRLQRILCAYNPSIFEAISRSNNSFISCTRLSPSTSSTKPYICNRRASSSPIPRWRM